MTWQRCCGAVGCSHSSGPSVPVPAVQWQEEVQELSQLLPPILALSNMQLRKIIFDNFGEWGPIENVHLVPSKTLAFVR